MTTVIAGLSTCWLEAIYPCGKRLHSSNSVPVGSAAVLKQAG